MKAIIRAGSGGSLDLRVVGNTTQFSSPMPWTAWLSAGTTAQLFKTPLESGA